MLATDLSHVDLSLYYQFKEHSRFRPWRSQLLLYSTAIHHLRVRSRAFWHQSVRLCLPFCNKQLYSNTDHWSGIS